MEFIYTAWFRELQVDPEDQDAGWPACFCIEAESSMQAKEWGDFLARNYTARNPTTLFLQSEILLPDDPLYKDVDSEVLLTPKVFYGEEATDQQIGW